MAIPHVFTPLKPGDFTLRSTKVHKPFVIQRSNLYSGSLPQTGSGYRIWEGLYTGEKLKISSSNYPTNSFDGTLKHVIWKSLDTQFYRFPYDKTATLEHANKRFTFKFLNYSSSILSLPYLDFGESIKPGSIEITGSGINLRDDKNGNLYDVNLDTGSYSSNYNLVGYWGFNNEFRKTKTIDHDTTFEKTEIQYESRVFSPDKGSVLRNIHIIPGVPLNLTSSGCCAHMHDSNIHTLNRKEFNFTKDDDFTISCWAMFEPYNNVSTIISKNTIISNQVYGLLDKINQNDLVVPTIHVSSSTTYNPTDVYPYRLEIDGTSGTIQFKRSDGISTLHLSGSTDLDDGSWHHFAVVKTGSNVILYEDGIAIHSGSDLKYNCHNKHDLLFGSDSLDGQTNSLLGKLDEIRIYNKGLSPSTITTLSDNSSLGMYQTSVVGNAFYRSGNIVISSLNPKYNKLFENDFTFKYRGTHTIYTYEALVRVKKGSNNLTLNPTALKSPLGDLLSDDFTGSFNEATLMPYCSEIGLYNDARELLAVAKLNQPIRMRQDVDLNFLIQIDV